MSKQIVNSIVPKNEIARLERENVPVINKAQALAVMSADMETEAYSILQQIKQRTDLIEKKRKDITKPLNASLKEVNALFKTISEPLVEADRIIRQKVLEFRAKREEQAQKRIEKLTKKMEKAKQAGDENRVETLTGQLTNTKAVVGESVTAKRWTFEITDIAKVPRKYLTIDSAAVRVAIRDGERDIPGLRIYQEQNLRVL